MSEEKMPPSALRSAKGVRHCGITWKREMTRKGEVLHIKAPWPVVNYLKVASAEGLKLLFFGPEIWQAETAYAGALAYVATLPGLARISVYSRRAVPAFVDLPEFGEFLAPSMICAVAGKCGCRPSEVEEYVNGLPWVTSSSEKHAAMSTLFRTIGRALTALGQRASVRSDEPRLLGQRAA